MSLITDSQTLADFCARLRGAPYITVDTEFLRDTTYWPKLCLIQIGGPASADVAAIDALAEGLDMQPLFDLLRDESVLKVFHSGRQDMEIFYDDGGRPAQADLRHPGRGDGLRLRRAGRLRHAGEEAGGANIDKSSRFADWSKRPLTDKQLNYALSDVTHLRQIYDQLQGAAGAHRAGALAGRGDGDPDRSGHLPRRLPSLAWQRLKSRAQ